MAYKKRQIPPVQPPQPEIVSVRLPGIAASSEVVPFLQGPGTNMLAAVSTTTRHGSNVIVDPITDEGRLEGGSGKLTVFLTQYSSLSGLKVSTGKLLDALIMKFTAQNGYRQSPDKMNTSVTLPLKEYLHMLGRDCPDDEKKNKNQLDMLRRSVSSDLNTLFNISIEWSESTGRNGDNSKRDYMRMRLITSQGISKGNILVNISPELSSYLCNSYIMNYHVRLLAVDERLQSAYHTGRKLLQVLNFAKRRDSDNTGGIISVKSLLEACPDIPSLAYVSHNGRRYDRDIIKPMESALGELERVGLINWNYCNAGGVPFDSEQLEKIDYKLILDSYISFTILGVSPENI